MKVQGVGNNAEYGAAGDITTITKSGTNAFHGAAAWYYQNAEFDAKAYLRVYWAAGFSPGTGDRSFLDLERANRDQLEAAGVRAEAIFASGLCTKTHLARLHSYRGDRDASGRMVGAIRAV